MLSERNRIVYYTAQADANTTNLLVQYLNSLVQCLLPTGQTKMLKHSLENFNTNLFVLQYQEDSFCRFWITGVLSVLLFSSAKNRKVSFPTDMVRVMHVSD